VGGQERPGRSLAISPVPARDRPGSDLDRAATVAFGKPLHALFEEWREELGNRYLLMPLSLLGAFAWSCAPSARLAWCAGQAEPRRLAQWDLEERLRRPSEPGASGAQVHVPPTCRGRRGSLAVSRTKTTGRE